MVKEKHHNINPGTVCIIMVITALLFISACISEPDNQTKNKPVVFVSILPQKYFVERITDNKFRVKYMIPPGYSPATYEPTPQQMKELKQATIYFRIGYIPFETIWIKKIAEYHKDLQIIDTSAGVDLINAEEHDHDHHHHHQHGHGGIDPHIWLSPKSVKIMAKNIETALSRRFPSYKSLFKKNISAFSRDIDIVNKEIEDLLGPKKGKNFLVFHPAWSYFAREYQLHQLAIEFEGKSPTPKGMKKISDIAQKKGIKVIFIQEQFDTSIAQAIAEQINGTVLKLDPLAENWLQNIRHIARQISLNLK